MFRSVDLKWFPLTPAAVPAAGPVLWCVPVLSLTPEHRCLLSSAPESHSAALNAWHTQLCLRMKCLSQERSVTRSEVYSQPQHQNIWPSLLQEELSFRLLHKRWQTRQENQTCHCFLSSVTIIKFLPRLSTTFFQNGKSEIYFWGVFFLCLRVRISTIFVKYISPIL